MLPYSTECTVSTGVCDPGTLLEGIDRPDFLDPFTLGLGTSPAGDDSVEQVIL